MDPKIAALKKQLQADVLFGSKQEMLEFYNEHADSYEKYIVSQDWEAPLETAKTAAELYPNNRENIRVLDVASGTGLVALEMTKLGFKIMDALDPSEQMLEMSRKTGLYDRYICDYVGNNRIDAENDTYDLITISGGLCVMLLADYVAGMKELIRISKPGACIVITTRSFHFSFDNEPQTDIEKDFSKLEQEGLWECIRKKKNVYISSESGAVAVYRKL